jgi:uncharacterized protein (TIGR02246 family)
VVTKESVRSLFELWNNALATGDSNIVTQLYAKDATLLPTLSNKQRTDHESIKNYFDGFLRKKPKGRILQGQIFIGDDHSWAQDNGIYEFVMEDGSIVQARYTFVYVQVDGDWKIAHHHSSLMPETEEKIIENQ